MARLLVGVSGGIAAYKVPELIRRATRAGHSVRVIQTERSERFVGRATFEAITGAPVLVSEFEPDPARGAYPGEPLPAHAPISHLALVERADLYLIAPATANTLARLAHGQAENLLTAAALAAPCPVLVAPAMNHRMYEHPATVANLARLRSHGVEVIPPGAGALASHGEHGIGRLAEPAELLEACERRLGRRAAWAGVPVLVTAGGTREPIDSVRFIGNRSSGRMGVALAAAAARRGAEVTLIAANLALPVPPGVRVVAVQTAAELAQACAVEFERCRVLFMSAAVADFRPVRAAERKLKKDAGVPVLELEPTEDVLGALAATRRPEQVVVGFAAEHGEGALAYAREKLERKRLDAIVVNDISRPDIGFDVASNEVTVLTADGGERYLPRAAKELIAAGILDTVEALRAKEEERGDGARAGSGAPA